VTPVAASQLCDKACTRARRLAYILLFLSESIEMPAFWHSDEFVTHAVSCNRKTLMINLHNIPLEWWLIGARAAALAIGFMILTAVLLSWRRTQRRDTQRLFEQLDIALAEIRSLGESNLTLGARLDEVIKRMEAPVRSLPAPAATSGVRGYEIAARMARNGASADELIQSCGLTRHEAELLIRLHSTAVLSNPTTPIAAPAAAKPVDPRPRAERELTEQLASARNFASRLAEAAVVDTGPAVPTAKPRSRLSVVG
jgi:hypothetical protein